MEVVRSEEELRVHRAERPSGSARVRTETVERDVVEVVDLMADDVEVVELPVTDPDTDSGQVETSPEGDLSVPVMAERLVLRKETYVEKRVLLRRRRRVHAREEVRETVRAERVVVDVEPAPTSGRVAAPTPERTVIEPGAPHVAIETSDDIHNDRSDT